MYITHVSIYSFALARAQFVFISSTVLPLDGLFLLLDHVCQLLEYRAQLHNSALNVLHHVCTALDVCILYDHNKKVFKYMAQKRSVALIPIQ